MSLDDKTPVAAIGLFLGAVIAAAIGLVYFFATHHCAKSHRETRMNCTTITVTGGVGYSTCSPYDVETCDEWETDK